MKNSVLDSLDETLGFIRDECSRATADAKHELHHISVATQGPEFPESRIVVFRAVDWERNALVFHTDVRSQKYRDMVERPKISLLGYSRKRKYQVRVRGHAVLNHKDSVAAQSWGNVGPGSQKIYLVVSPGLPITQPSSGLPAAFEGRELDSKITHAGFENFVCVTVFIQTIEWLILAREGHRRCRFEFIEGSRDPVTKNWLCP